MITTVTLNPAVDKTCTLTSLRAGSVNRMESVKNLAGGKGINVTKVLRQYDFPVRALGFLGGYTGRFIEEYTESIGAQCDFTHVAGETRTNINVLAQDGYVTELLEPGAVISEEELVAFYEAFEKSIESSELIIMSGSVPAGVPADVYKVLTQKAAAYGKKVLLDTSGDFLKEGVTALPFMIKPNVKELEVLAGKKMKDREDILHAALHFNMLGIPHVMVSMGEKGLLYVTGQKAYFAHVPGIKAVNTVGCGDSVVAAFAMGILSEESPKEILKWCAAISAANATTLESAVIPKENAEELVADIIIENLA